MIPFYNFRAVYLNKGRTLCCKCCCPFSPSEATPINANIAVQEQDGAVCYFNAMMPIFSHAVDDTNSFRMFTSQLYINGTCTQAEIVRTFGVSKSTVKRDVKQYREEGPGSFFTKTSSPKKPRVLTPEVISQAQALLDKGTSKEDAAKALSIKQDTFNKAIRAGRLTLPIKVEAASSSAPVSSKSERSEADSQSPMGMGCLRTLERAAAFRGDLSEAPVRFELAHDVKNGGVLCALPALLANRLLKDIGKYFSLPKGFYSLVHILLLLGFMALSRVKSMERLRYEPPGEWGKILGLDRIPEVRTMRDKVKHLSDDGRVPEWMADLSTFWMERLPESACLLYVDGHIRPYYGLQTKLPRRRMARLRLCLRGMSDYWVNDRWGRPFFVISSPLTSGMLNMLHTEIVPRLLKDMPNQPAQAELDADPCRHRFVLIFDREGYSPDFISEMWVRHRIAVQTYHKYPEAAWPVDDFKTYKVQMAWGNTVIMKLAERRTCLSNGFEVREIRRLSDNGHQTAIISADYVSDLTAISGHMFNRWSQENFFKYMMQEFDIDKLVSYKLEGTDETKKVINPVWRKLDGQFRSMSSKLNKSKVEFANLGLEGDLDEVDVEEYEFKKGQLRAVIESFENEVEKLKVKRGETSKHITIGQLPEDERFKLIAPTRKQFIDTIKIIAYRAETAMAMILRDILFRPDDARSLLKQIYRSEADLIPNEEEQTLTVCLHHLANPMADKATRKLFETLNETDTIYPGTNLKMVFQLGNMGST